jgi:hypothetical protein
MAGQTEAQTAVVLALALSSPTAGIATGRAPAV